MTDTTDPLIQPLGDTAWLATGTVSDVAGRPVGVTDVVPAFERVAVHFDPTIIPGAAVRAWLSGVLIEESRSDGESRPPVAIPVVYGSEHGPDLARVAHGAGLSADDVVRRHTATEYSVGAVGFQPGFPYLNGLPAKLRTPRQGSPRTRVPAGSVAIGGAYTGVYPIESPGGWNLIGRTPLRLFEPDRDPPALLRVGDRVRFEPVDHADFFDAAPGADARGEPESPVLRVVSPGALTTLQGPGRFGAQHHGVGPGGAMDRWSFRLANLLASNRPDAAALECTLVGPVLECLDDVTIGLAGAAPVATQKRFTKGETIDLRKLCGGARAYVSVPGGFAGPQDRALQAGDLLGLANATELEIPPSVVAAAPRLSGVGWTLQDEPINLRVVRGPHANRFSTTACSAFAESEYRVTPQSNRMGVRLEGPSLPDVGRSDEPSIPVCHGAIQVPPDGQPIALGADRQTIGGYPVVAVVASADWPLLGQLRPGDRVRLAEVTLADAVRARRQVERELAIAAYGIESTGFYGGPP